MPYELNSPLIVGVSSSALFDLSHENTIFETRGLDEYVKYQIEHEKEILKPGPGFKLIKSLLQLNELVPEKRLVEVIIMSRNNANSSLRIFNSINHYNLDIIRAALTGGMPIKPYAEAFNINLFLSTHVTDVQDAINSNIPSGLIYNTKSKYKESNEQIKLAFDGDAVIFSDESEKIYKRDGLEAFSNHEKTNALKPLPEGPFANFLRLISQIQNEFPIDECPIRTALVTARSSPAHERVIRTLQAWDIKIDEVFFMGGVRKAEILKAFGADIFFDDQHTHLKDSANVVPSARVPYKNLSEQIELFEEGNKDQKIKNKQQDEKK
ncbi:5'-nucleotidase [Haloplasma contractile]|uniref:5'-nucleotidase protein n=1 Tax=Haloplasma contractile SSD-17B TaxID=1033810 RepID=U2FPX5_9MOLU|nr:5'-nucleotidase [Haloplasma contractile]ERJ13094.1 5'-nucleotidase protein [Haloplasma contractile SSD-17B]